MINPICDCWKKEVRQIQMEKDKKQQFNPSEIINKVREQLKLNKNKPKNKPKKNTKY